MSIFSAKKRIPKRLNLRVGYVRDHTDSSEAWSFKSSAHPACMDFGPRHYLGQNQRASTVPKAQTTHRGHISQNRL